MIYKVIDVRGDGSCFYRAVHKCLKHTNLLQRISKMILKTSKLPNQIDFVHLSRSVISELIRKKEDFDIVKNVYSNLKSIDAKSYNAILKSSFPSWFVNLFQKLPQRESIFRSKIVDAVLKRTNWVSEVEVTIFKTLLFMRCKINLHILNKLPLQTFQVGHDSVYIYNIDESHYNAITFQMSKDCNNDNKTNSKTPCRGLRVIVDNNR